MNTIQTETIMSFTQACRSVCKYCANPYARAYAQAGLSMHGHDSMSQQAGYILSNISHWRGEQARLVKNTLREFV